MKYILIVQLTTYVALAVWMFKDGQYRLGAAQALLTGVQALLFWEVLK